MLWKEVNGAMKLFYYELADHKAQPNSLRINVMTLIFDTAKQIE